VNSLGAEASLLIIGERDVAGAEPPPPAAAAMLRADVVVAIPEKWNMVHTDARAAATAAGVRFLNFSVTPEEMMRQPISIADYELIARKTERLAQLLTEANEARVTSLAGTDITMSLKGRRAMGAHPMSEPWTGMGIPGIGEATLAPVEGTAEGVAVIDIALAGRNRLLREPVHMLVRGGRIADLKGPKEEVEWLRELASRDEGANVICQLAIGTSHMVPAEPIGGAIDRQREGRIHIAFGRNDDFGGTNFSRVHVDCLFGGTSVFLDGKPVIENERILL